MNHFTTITDAKRQTGLSYLGSVNVSSKLKKNKTVSKHYTYCIYLAPATQSGYNVCPYSTPECRLGCLATSGRAGMEEIAGKTMIHDARVKKAKLLKEETAFFMQWMIAEIKQHKLKAERDGFGFSIRLNGTADIDWAKIFVDGKNIFNIFKDVMFYDYTKNPNKFNYLPDNYHLTFSYTGKNNKDANDLLKRGYNVAVVFNVKGKRPLPDTFNGFDVVDGDLTDFRPDDAKGVVIGLRWKHIGNKDAEKQILNSCFVITPEYTGVKNAAGNEIMIGDIIVV